MITTIVDGKITVEFDTANEYDLERITRRLLGAEDQHPEARRAVEEYKRSLVIQLNAWALEEREKDTAAWLKPAPLLQRVAEKIEKGEL